MISMEQLTGFMQNFQQNYDVYFPQPEWNDVVEVVIISFLVYQIMLWIKNTKAWSLLKGIMVIMIFVLLAAVFRMNTILWIAKNVFNLAAMAVVVVFQPELRRALEQLGRKNILASLLPFENEKEAVGRFSDRTLNEIVKASFEMGKVKTGALIVIENTHSLAEYERTGIDVDGIVTSQLLINIFEHNTPLHDGAVIVRGDRIVSATCYLPLSDNMALSKELGTRHRAGVGISEATDSMTVIVSEETGHVSVAYEGELMRNLDAETLKQKLLLIQSKPVVEKKRRIWKGRSKGEKENNG